MRARVNSSLNLILNGNRSILVTSDSFLWSTSPSLIDPHSTSSEICNHILIHMERVHVRNLFILLLDSWWIIINCLECRRQTKTSGRGSKKNWWVPRLSLRKLSLRNTRSERLSMGNLLLALKMWQMHSSCSSLIYFCYMTMSLNLILFGLVILVRSTFLTVPILLTYGLR